MIDLKQTADGDIDMTTGDVQWAATDRATEQHIGDILTNSQGDVAEAPLTGVGLIDYINSSDNRLMFRDISQQLQKDGMKVQSIDFDEHGDIKIDGDYENGNN